MQTETRQLDEPAPTHDEVDWLIGQTVDRFVVRRVVGRGGMGLVVEAHDPGLDRPVALKLVLDRRASSSAGQRLVREARAMARLSHPNVVQVHEVGTVDGQVFIVMELVRGRTLSQWLGSRPSRAKILDAFAAAGAALHAAHRAGLVHRDFKPSNVLIDDDGRVRVTDFGIALQLVGVGTRPPRHPIDEPADPGGDALDDASWKRRLADLTRTGAAIGTPRYMAPEQRDGGEVTPQSDQYAFCVALWEAVFGRHPFGAPDLDPDAGVRSTIASTPRDAAAPSSGSPHRIRTGRATAGEPATADPQAPRRHDVPGHVVAALRRGLARAAADRWPSMEALGAALSPRLPRWPWLVLPIVAAGTLAVGYALSRSAEPSCAAVGDERIALVWNAAARARVRAAFEATRLPAASPLAERATGMLDRFAESWRQVFADGCTGARASDQAAAAADRRLACLDHRLQSLTGVLAVFAGTPTAELASRGDAVVATLPAPEECANELLGEAQRPPPGKAPAVAQLQRRLAEAEANAGAGRIEVAAAQLATLRDDVYRLGWAPLRVRTDLAAGGLAALRGRPAVELLTSAAKDATANHMDLVAAKAWAAALTAAGSQLSNDQIDLLAGMARAQAERTGDALLVAAVEISEGRARTRLGNMRRGEELCRDAVRAVGTNGSDRARAIESDANACLVESLSGQDRWREVEPLTRGLIERWTARNPIDHPVMSDYLNALGSALNGRGAFAEARRVLEQGLEIRRKTLGPTHPRTIAMLDALAQVSIAAGDPARAEAIIRDAIALVTPTIRSGGELLRDQSPEHALGLLHRELGDIAAARGDGDGARGHFERAVELTRRTSGETSHQYGVLLLSLSQFYGADRIDEAIATNRKAREILVAYGDQARAGIATGLLGTLYARSEQWAEALPLLAETVAKLAPTTPRHTRGVLQFYLARAIESATEDHAKAAATARAAEATLEANGPASTATLERLRAFMHKTGLDRVGATTSP